MNINNSIHNVYSVPYLNFKNSDRVIVYGVGRVGKSYIRSICESQRCNLVAIVDRNYINHKPIHNIVVESPNIIKSCDFDYILIAVEQYKAAKEIRDSLIESGINADKIVWNCNANIGEQIKPHQEYIKLLERNIILDKRRFFLFMLPEHGNAGDYLIGYSELHFFKKYFSNIQVITVTTLEWTYAKEYIMGMVRPDDTIFMNGGGYIGDVWQDTENYKSVIEAFPNNVKIFFPNTLTFLSNDMAYPEFIKEMNWFSSKKNVHIMFRDKRSYQYASNYDVNATYFPDIALINPLPISHEIQTNRVLLCLREDREKFIDSNRLKKQLENMSIEFDELKISKGTYLSQEEGHIFVDELVKEIQMHRLLITDRLHGMIMATISNTPCIAFDNISHKVSGVHEWIKEYVCLASKDDIENIGEKISCAMKNKENSGNYKSLLEFDQMAEYVKMIVEERLNE